MHTFCSKVNVDGVRGWRDHKVAITQTNTTFTSVDEFRIFFNGIIVKHFNSQFGAALEVQFHTQLDGTTSLTAMWLHHSASMAELARARMQNVFNDRFVSPQA